MARLSCTGDGSATVSAPASRTCPDLVTAFSSSSAIELNAFAGSVLVLSTFVAMAFIYLRLEEKD